MRWYSSLALVTLLALPAPSWSIVIEADKTKVQGHLVKETPERLTIRFVGPDGLDVEKDFDRKAIRVIHRIDIARLEALTSKNPQSYRNYAEVLAAEKDDPEAQELAIRLFAIAAALDPEKLGRSCLRDLQDLPLGAAYRRKCATLSYLLDPKKDADVFKPGPVPPRARTSWDSFLEGLRELRRGRTREAARKLQTPDTQKHFGAFPGLLSLPDVLALSTKYPSCTDSPRCTAGWRHCPTCNGKGKTGIGGKVSNCPDCNGKGQAACKFCKDLFPGLPVEQLQILTSLELAEEDEGGARHSGPSGQRWSSIMKTSPATPIRMPTLDTITPYNPRQCLFRNGQWVEP